MQISLRELQAKKEIKHFKEHLIFMILNEQKKFNEQLSKIYKKEIDILAEQTFTITTKDI